MRGAIFDRAKKSREKLEDEQITTTTEGGEKIVPSAGRGCEYETIKGVRNRKTRDPRKISQREKKNKKAARNHNW